MTANFNGFDADDRHVLDDRHSIPDARLDKLSAFDAGVAANGAAATGVLPRLRQLADSAIKRRMSTEMADLAQQIRRFQSGGRA